MSFVWFWTFWHWSQESFLAGLLLRSPLHGIGSHWDEWFRHEASESDAPGDRQSGADQIFAAAVHRLAPPPMGPGDGAAQEPTGAGTLFSVNSPTFSLSTSGKVSVSPRGLWRCRSCCNRADREERR